MGRGRDYFIQRIAIHGIQRVGIRNGKSDSKEGAYGNVSWHASPDLYVGGHPSWARQNDLRGVAEPVFDHGLKPTGKRAVIILARSF